MPSFTSVISYKDGRPIDGENEIYVGHSISPDAETAVLAALQALDLLNEDRKNLDISCSEDDEE